MSNALIIVSNRLPVTLRGDTVTKSAGGLVAALEGLSQERYTTKWIGWPGTAIPETARQVEIARILTEEHGCVPMARSLLPTCVPYTPLPTSASSHR